MPFQLKNYSILKKITDYGKGELFLAIELSGNQMVMIKKLPLPAAHRSLFMERFQNEVSNTNNLSSKNIISIIEYGSELDYFYIVMEYIDGCDLNWLTYNSSFDRPIGLMIITEALQALHYSHTRGIVHCDIKPANLLIERSGRVVLTNFGLSRSINSNKLIRFATPLFMPPEQAYLVSGQNDIKKDHLEETILIQYNRNVTPEKIQNLSEHAIQWDIWSAGVLMYRVCSGHYPFYSENFPDLLNSIVYENPSNIADIVPDVPKSITKMIGQCLQKDPYLRPHSLDPVINALQEYFYSLGIAHFKELIATYLKKNCETLPFSIEPHITNDNLSQISSQPKTEQQVLDEEFDEYIHKYTDSQQNENFTIDDSTESPIPAFVSLQDSDVVDNGPGWEFIEYKTLKYVPSESDEKAKSEGLFTGLFRKCLFLFTTMIQEVAIGVKSLFSFLFMYRTQFIQIILVLMTLSALVISGTFIIKNFPKLRNKHTEISTTNDRHVSEIPQRKESAIPAPDNKPSPENISPTLQNNFEQPQKKNAQILNSLSKTSSEPADIPFANKSRQLTSYTAVQSKLSKSYGNSSQKFNEQKSEPQESQIVATNIENSETDIPGLLKITVDPTSTRVYIDGTLLNRTEFTVGKSLPKGTHTITAEASGYQSYSNTVFIESDKTIILSLTLKPDVKGNGQIHIYSYPWANLTVDGELIGTSPTAVPIVLAEGMHKLTLSRDGYQVHTEEVSIKNGEILRLQIQLKKAGK